MNTLSNYVNLQESELLAIEGGGILEDAGKFLSNTWDTLYYSGRDFGRSVVNALIP